MTTHPEPVNRIIFPAPGEVTLEEYTLPAPRSDELRIRTLFSLMSIGTETTILHGRYDKDTHFARMFSFPQLQTGVQAVGVVETTGSRASEFKGGDLVYMRMAHGSHQVLPEAQCSPVPAGIDLHQACWCGLAKTAFRAAWAGDFQDGTQVLIVGAGPVGQMLVRWAAALGCAEIAVVDVSKQRLGHARAGGATHLLAGTLETVLPEVAELGNGAGPPLVVDCTGNPAVFQPALAAARRFGKVILLGDTGFPERQCLSSDLMTKGLTLQATHDSHDLDGWTERRVDELFFSKLKDGKFPLEGLITHEFSPTDCEQAYALAEREREKTMGILFDWTTMEQSHADNR